MYIIVKTVTCSGGWKKGKKNIEENMHISFDRKKKIDHEKRIKKRKK